MNKSKVPKLYDELYEWIERGPIVEAIIRALWEEGLALNGYYAKNLWYRVLEEIPDILAIHARRQVRFTSLVEKEIKQGQAVKDNLPI